MTISRTLGALALALAMSNANAAMITLSSINVDFEFDDSLLGLFGGFGAEDNTLELHEPALFKAETGSFGVVSASQATPNIEIIAHPGFKVIGVKLFEAGEYFRLGANANVGAGGQFIVNDTSIGFSAGNLDHTTTFAAFNTTPWEIASEVATDGHEVNVKLVNTLVAGIGAPGVAEFASIRKNRVEIGALVAPTAVPLPPAIGLMGFTLMGLIARGRSQRAC